MDGDGGAHKASEAVYCDSYFGTRSRYYAKQMAQLDQPAYLYFFTRVPPSPKQTLGAFHAADIAFVFGKTVPLFPRNDYDQALAQTMGDYWAQFAKTGNPNMEGLPEWPAFSDSDPRNMVFGPKVGAAAVERAEAYDIFEGHLLRLIDTMQGAAQ